MHDDNTLEYVDYTVTIIATLDVSGETAESDFTLRINSPCVPSANVPRPALCDPDPCLNAVLSLTEPHLFTDKVYELREPEVRYEWTQPPDSNFVTSSVTETDCGPLVVKFTNSDDG